MKIKTSCKLCGKKGETVDAEEGGVVEMVCKGCIDKGMEEKGHLLVGSYHFNLEDLK